MKAIIKLMWRFILTGFVLANAGEVLAATITSPNGEVVTTIEAPTGNLNYSVTFRDQTVVETSSLGLTVNGTTYSSGVAAGTTSWYRVTVTLDDTTLTATMAVTNLTAGGVVVDLNSATAGTSFSRTWSSGQWVLPTNFVARWRALREHCWLITSL